VTVDSRSAQRLVCLLDPELKAKLEQQRGETFDAEFFETADP
jgi:hypothetical protein